VLLSTAEAGFSFASFCSPRLYDAVRARVRRTPACARAGTMRAMGRSPIIVYEGVSIAPLVFTLRSSGSLLNVRH
jgi:hypothetical protein